MLSPRLAALASRLSPVRSFGPVILPPGVERVQVVGDVHGCSDLLERLVPRLDPDCPIVFVGDYVDRGPDPLGTLARLRALDAEPGVTCLMGNHEAMLLDALDAPERAMLRWVQGGGDATLAACGLGRTADLTDPPALAERLAEALGPRTVAWLRARPLLARFGNLAVTHAGADPRRPLDDQPPEALLWGHRDFGRLARLDGAWVAHGHVIVPRVRARAGIIGTDTGAWRTGRLSAAEIGAPRHLRWIHTG